MKCTRGGGATEQLMSMKITLWQLVNPKARIKLTPPQDALLRSDEKVAHCQRVTLEATTGSPVCFNGLSQNPTCGRTWCCVNMWARFTRQTARHDKSWDKSQHSEEVPHLFTYHRNKSFFNSEKYESKEKETFVQLHKFRQILLDP